MNDILKLIAKILGKKLSRTEQLKWSKAIHKVVDDRIYRFHHRRESADLLSFSEWQKTDDESLIGNKTIKQ